MAGPTGFEPAISTVTGWRVRPLHYGPKEFTGELYLMVYLSDKGSGMLQLCSTTA